MLIREWYDKEKGFVSLCIREQNDLRLVQAYKLKRCWA